MTDADREPEEPKRQSSPALPDSRLNPLLNPLLAKQLGRWAHIYYTAPVDKREEAVEQLLRELEAESAKIAAAGNAPAAAAPAALDQFAPWPEAADEPIRNTGINKPELIGNNNDTELTGNEELELPAEFRESRAEHESFAAPASPASNDPACEEMASAESSDAASTDAKPWPIGLRETETPGVDLPFKQAPADDDLANAEPASFTLPHSESLNLESQHPESPNLGLRNIQRAESRECEVEGIAFAPTTNQLIVLDDPPARERAPISIAGGTARAWYLRRQSFVVAATLALAVGTVLWVTHRSVASISIAHPSIAHPETAAPAEPVVSSSTQPAAPSTSSPTAPDQIPLPAQSGTAEVGTTTGSQPASSPDTSLGSETRNASHAGPTPPPAKIVADKENGDKDDKEETSDADLATGLRYLQGAGVERDSELAVRHLWKAVSKHNGSALIVLAGLYAKGDGVDKNCDQARVLILAAARQKTKHVETALETLHQSGCE